MQRQIFTEWTSLNTFMINPQKNNLIFFRNRKFFNDMARPLARKANPYAHPLVMDTFLRLCNVKQNSMSSILNLRVHIFFLGGGVWHLKDENDLFVSSGQSGLSWWTQRRQRRWRWRGTRGRGRTKLKTLSRLKRSSSKSQDGRNWWDYGQISVIQSYE